MTLKKEAASNAEISFAEHVKLHLQELSCFQNVAAHQASIASVRLEKPHARFSPT
jgi:hypothetical protein